ncbi:SAM-dependent methyltransferase [Bacteriovorax sp. DB6_IX]|uniref:SAM-dependent methyltransferase n=1 Tax=Bacteriovorax sp. DB6_IX TaxID=1353530 RepID=UPI00038A4719|nr:SAM-dependent methyltransferase [Bacteriovorax sp. DB6_IX]EQC52072.1 putative ribosomal RNA large subunit methyltransferase J [Bacteriovorax sp. DB6_IX]
MNSFYLFFYDTTIKDLLLEELQKKHPKLTLSFSNKEIISMKGPSGYAKYLEDRPVIFSKRQALFIEKTKENDETKESILVGKDYWVYETIDTYNDFLELPEIEMPEQSPARAWHKMREAHEQFALDIERGQQVIEIGSAPGGISYYLLELGVNLVCIDPAEMSPVLSQNYQSSFKHIKESVFEIKKFMLPKTCDWIISDLNLKGDLNLDQTRRLMSFYPQLKGAFLTVKTPTIKDLKKINIWANSFNEGFEAIVTHLPSHRREIGIIVYNTL